jgi:uncharacterized protein with HEPN domain
LPSKTPILRLEDILANIELIQEDTRGYSYDTFARDRKCQDAVERCVSRISEATSKLEGSIESIIPDQPWSQIRAVGNVLQHEYDRVNPIFIWRIVSEDLQPLKIAIQFCAGSLSTQNSRRPLESHQS